MDFDFAKLFEDGREVDSADFGRVTLRRHDAGELLLTTGRVVACDPSEAAEAAPFGVAIEPGRYPVSLSVARFDDGDERVAGALLSFGAGAAVRWELALLPGEDPADLGEGEVFGYGAESSYGCLLDEEAADLYADAAASDESDVDERIGAALDAAYVDTWSWANLVLDERTGLNLIVFSAGLGEGPYASYFGYDADGRPAALVTDFALFEHSELKGRDG